MNPGTRPARKRSLIDTCASTPYTTMMTDGGMIGPTMADAALHAAAKAASKPSFFIALISTVPRPAASACATPDMPAKIRLAKMLTCARPPRRWPTSATANSKIRAAMPPMFIRLPASTNSGIASNGKLSMPEDMRCTTSEIGTGELNCSQARAAATSANATGNSMAIRPNMTRNMGSTLTASPPLDALSPVRGAHVR